MTRTTSGRELAGRPISIRAVVGRSVAEGTSLSQPLDHLVRLTGEAVLASSNPRGASHHAATRKTKEIA